MNNENSVSRKRARILSYARRKIGEALARNRTQADTSVLPDQLIETEKKDDVDRLKETELDYQTDVNSCNSSKKNPGDGKDANKLDRVLSKTQHLKGNESKRKRPTDAALPKPAITYTHTGKSDFNIFHDGFLKSAELCILLASQMPVDDLISLYAISRDFHTLIDQRFTTVILNQATKKAYESSRIFSFHYNAHLCRDDPVARLPHPNPKRAAEGVRRTIPSFRWLKFVLHREKTIQEIMAIFAECGCPLPERCSLTLKRLWFLFDIPDNARRIGYIHNRKCFTDVDLFHAMCFFVKLDMMCNDPSGDSKNDELQKMMLSSVDGFDTILKVLKGQMWNNELDAVVAYLRYRAEMRHLINQHQTNITDVFGVPVNQIGSFKNQYWGRMPTSTSNTSGWLARPDHLVMREACRRGLQFQRHVVKCMQYGYMDTETLERCKPRSYGRMILDLEDEEYKVNDLVGGVRALSVKDGGDFLLDLGDADKGSRYCIRPETTSAKERELRQQEKDRLSCYMSAWRSESNAALK